jgi:hypothetical protein
LGTRLKQNEKPTTEGRLKIKYVSDPSKHFVRLLGLRNMKIYYSCKELLYNSKTRIRFSFGPGIGYVAE